MRTLVESLKRLYESNRITKEQLLLRVESGKITIEEYNYIIGSAEDELYGEGWT